MDKPIIFSTDMVKAILAGRKSQTRRVVKPQPPHATFHRRMGEFGCDIEVADGYYMNPPIKPDDTLWVRETWCKFGDIIGVNEDADVYYYKADYSCPVDKSIKRWRPSIHMPREASRISLLVKNIRVERLQDITPYDAWNEGCRIGNSLPWEQHIPELQQQCRDVVFRGLWDSINAKRGFGWATNPFCWVISFEVIKKGC